MQEFYLNGAVLYEGDLRLMFPGIMFPEHLRQEDADVVNAQLIHKVEKPVPLFNEEVFRNGVEVIDGLVYEKWEVHTLTSQQVINKLTAIKNNYLKQINNDDNKIYADVIGNKTTEYLKAAEDAKAYKLAGYPENDVPDYVQSWADAKLWTARQACDDIIAQEAAWQYAAKLIREHRLKAKESVKRAVTPEEVETAMTIWNGFVVFIRSQLKV